MKMQIPAQFDSVQRRMLRTLLGIFGLVWLINAAFQAVAWLAVPSAKANFIQALAKPASKVPDWIRPLLLAAVHGTQAIGAEIVAGVMVLIAVLLGLALLTCTQVALAARVGIVYSIICWVFLNGFGFHYGNGQTDPGVFVAYAIAFLFVLSAAPAVQGRSADVPGPDQRLWKTASIVFGLLWLFDAVLKWVPAFLLHFTSQITSVIPGQPHWVAVWLTFVATVVHAIGPIPVAIFVALVETAIALGLLSGKWPRPVIAFGIAYSLLVWVTAEAFGGPYSAAGTGVRGNVLGNVLIYLIPFLFLWVGSRRGGANLETPEVS